MITLRDLSARSGRELKSSEVWMKLNEVYQKKTIQIRNKPFREFDDFCVIEENAYDAMKSMRTAASKASGSGPGNTESGRGRGRGASNAASTPGASGGGRSGGSRGAEVVRYIPNKYNNLPKKSDPGETDRIFKNNLCFSCREPGHSAGAQQCVFFDRGKFAFANVPREMTKAQYETLQRGRGTALNAMDDFENNNALPEPEEQLRIQSAPHQQSQGNGSLHQ